MQPVYSGCAHFTTQVCDAGKDCKWEVILSGWQVGRKGGSSSGLARVSCYHVGLTMKATMDITIYHNPRCGTSRKTLELIRAAGVEPTIIDYLTNPPSHALLKAMAGAAGLPVRALLRSKEAAYAELGLADPALTDDALIDAMLARPILIERPLVVCPKGVRLCRPTEKVLEIL